MATSSADRITNCARVLLALTKDWQAADGNAATLSDARAMLARSIYAIDGKGFPEPASDELVKQRDLQDTWTACVAAARSTLDEKGEPYEPYGSRLVLWTADSSDPGRLGDVQGLGLNWPTQSDSHVARVSGPILDQPHGKPKRLFFFDRINEQFAIEKDGGAGLGLWPRADKIIPTADGTLASPAILPRRMGWATALFILWLLSGIGLTLGMWWVGELMHDTAPRAATSDCALATAATPAPTPSPALKIDKPTACDTAWSRERDLVSESYDALARRVVWIMIGSGPSFSLIRPLIGTMLSMAILLLAVGLAWKGLWFGVLIDERNRLSMSRVQQAAWTILLLSGLIVMAWFNATLMRGAQATNAGFELFPAMDAQLWAALGVNLLVTPILSSAILTGKAAAQQGQTDLALRQFVRPAALDKNPSPKQWSWLDLVTGETTDTQDQVDIGRVQHLIISGGLLTTYFVALIGWLDHVSGSTIALAVANHNALFTNMPDVGSGTFVGLLALSHAGYLAFKARDGADPGSSSSGTSGTRHT
jgi:hypothetical protein